MDHPEGAGSKRADRADTGDVLLNAFQKIECGPWARIPIPNWVTLPGQRH